MYYSISDLFEYRRETQRDKQTESELDRTAVYDDVDTMQAGEEEHNIGAR